MKEKLRRWLRAQDGQSLVEYALIVALVAVACIGALTLLGHNANQALNTAAAAI